MEKYINGGIIKSFTVFYNSEEKLVDVMEELQEKVARFSRLEHRKGRIS